ncbi:MAG: response regulator [Candidatus Accumulibacter sp.]|jgi:two-component system response regulator DctR|nr:response regulator [Accumulibacter sp.]
MTQFAYIVDDDEAIRDSLGWLMQSRGIPCKTFASAEAFLEAWDASFAGCILLDIRMGEMSGNELFDYLIERGCRLPVIFLTGHGEVPLAVSTLKNGAFDFVEKPCNDNLLADRVLEAFNLDDERRKAAAQASLVKGRLARLTPREKLVMERILAGKLNKVIAYELNIGMRTVEVHRASLFQKMGVRTAVELARVVMSSSDDPSLESPGGAENNSR